MHAERCTCRECRTLDALPRWRQGIPDTFQFALFGKDKRGADPDAPPPVKPKSR